MSTAPSAAPLGGVRAALQIRGALRRFGVRVLASHPVPPTPAAGRGARTLLVGPDPIRVLVFGCGLGIGYGVTDRSRAFDGHLARALQQRTGRGVVIENRARMHDDGTRADRESCGSAGARTFDVAIYAPDYLSIAEHVRLHAWTALFERVAAQMADETAPLVFAPYPLVGGRHIHLALIRAQVVRAHRALQAVASRHGHTVADQGRVTLQDPGGGMFNEPYYASCTPPIAEAVLKTLKIRALATTA